MTTTIAEATDGVLAGMGFRRPGRFSNDGLPDLPQDPTALSDDDVAQFYFAFVGWTAYAESERRNSDIEYKAIEAKLNRARDRAMAGDVKGSTVTAKKAAVALDPVVMDLAERLLAAEILRDALDDVCRRCELFKTAMSREMSRRGNKSSKWGD